MDLVKSFSDVAGADDQVFVVESPHAVMISPPATNAPPDAPLTFLISDGFNAAVHVGDILVMVNGDLVWSEQAGFFGWTGATAVEDDGQYKLTLFPPDGFAYDSHVDVQLNLPYGSHAPFDDAVTTEDAIVMERTLVLLTDDAVSTVDAASVQRNYMRFFDDTVSAADDKTLLDNQKSELDTVSTTDAFSVALNPLPTNLVLWLKADAGVTKDGSNHVSTWADQSGYGRDFSIAAGTITWVDAQQNGLPILRAASAGSPNYMTGASFFAGAQKAEVFVLIKANTSGTNYAWSGFGSDNLDISHYLFSGTDLYETFGVTNGNRQGPITVPNAGAATRAYGIYNVTVDGPSAGSYVIRLNSVVLGTGGAAGVIGWQATTFYLFSGAINQSFQFQGDIGEVRVYDAPLSSSDRTAVYNDLKAKWGTTDGV